VNFISINLSGHSVANAQFMPILIALIDESNIDASKICFEVTETTAISNLSAANTFISALKDLGCRFALDDFGSGLSSFGYLKNLPVDYLKIDGMFVKDMIDDPIDKAMVKSINDIGHVMGMKTIAEFVENKAIMEQLNEIGVDYAQGYGIGKPEPFNDVISQFENI
jgi:EAL domain-containing protein (putative c-di-GMP-specific phosphodiesterase class I)